MSADPGVGVSALVRHVLQQQENPLALQSERAAERLKRLCLDGMDALFLSEFVDRGRRKARLFCESVRGPSPLGEQFVDSPTHRHAWKDIRIVHAGQVVQRVVYSTMATIANFRTLRCVSIATARLRATERITPRTEPVACAYCGDSAVPLGTDHVEPLGRGGEHAQENVVWCCRRCNSSKGQKFLLEWIVGGLSPFTTYDGEARTARRCFKARWPRVRVIRIEDGVEVLECGHRREPRLLRRKMLASDIGTAAFRKCEECALVRGDGPVYRVRCDGCGKWQSACRCGNPSSPLLSQRKP